MALHIDILYHIAAFATDSDVTSIYVSSKLFSFLKPRIQEIESERSFLIGSIARCLLNSGFHSPSELEKILMALKKESLAILQALYDCPQRLWTLDLFNEHLNTKYK